MSRTCRALRYLSRGTGYRRALCHLRGRVCAWARASYPLDMNRPLWWSNASLSPQHTRSAPVDHTYLERRARGAVNLHPPRGRPRRRKNTVKIPGSRWTAERSPECGSLPLLCRTSTSLGACGWSTGCLVLSSVRGLQMNVCWINGTRSLVERSHEVAKTFRSNDINAHSASLSCLDGLEPIH